MTLADELERLGKLIDQAKANAPQSYDHIDGGERRRAFEQHVAGLMLGVVDHLPAIIAALRAQEWMPIETAPRDGTKVLLWPGYLMGGDPMTGWWARLARKWVAAGEPFDSQPTHWRPLPTPPAHDKGEPK